MRPEENLRPEHHHEQDPNLGIDRQVIVLMLIVAVLALVLGTAALWIGLRGG